MNWQIDCLAEAESTNWVARKRVLAAWERNETSAGIVVTAAKQTAGRGQHGRRWESPAGGLYMSAVIEGLPTEIRGRLALVAGVATADAIAEPCTFFAEAGSARLGELTLHLRWPNDLVVTGTDTRDRKVGGILCESVAMGDRWAGIVGIGINVVTAVEDFSPALRGRVTSLTAHDGRLRTVTGMLDAVLQHLAKVFAMCHETEGWKQLLARIRHLDGLRGRQIVVERMSEQVEGVAAGIDDAGALMIETSHGRVTIDIGTIMAVDGTAIRL